MKNTDALIKNENIMKAYDKVCDLEQADYDKLVDEFILEQPIIASVCSYIQQQENEDYFYDFFDYIIILWQAYTLQLQKVPQVSKGTFEEVSNGFGLSFDELAEHMEVKSEEEMLKKLDDLNNLIKNNSGKDIETVISKLSEEQKFLAQKALEAHAEFNQPEIFDFLFEELEMNESDQTKEGYDKNEMFNQIMMIVHSLDKEINKSSLMK